MTKQELQDLNSALVAAKIELYRCPAFDISGRFGNVLRSRLDRILAEINCAQLDIREQIDFANFNFAETENPKEEFHNAYAVMEYLKTRDRSLMLKVHDLMQTKVPTNVIKQLFRDYYGTDDEYREMTCKVSTYVTLISIDNQ